MSNEDLFRLENRLKRIEAALCAPDRLAYTMAEATEALRISEPTLRDWMRRGRLTGTRTTPTGAWLFPVENVKAALTWKEAAHESL